MLGHNHSKKNIQHPKIFSINKQLVLKDLQRRAAFISAASLGFSAMRTENKHILSQLVDIACAPDKRQDGTFWLPWITFGQFHLQKPHEECKFPGKIILNKREMMENDIQLEELLRLLDASQLQIKFTEFSCSIEVLFSPKVNIIVLLARHLDQLAELGVRLIILREAGNPELHCKMRPEFSFIYSNHKMDSETGFKPNYWPAALDRGGEPYYCPNGWKRMAIDVGMTGEEFEEAYHDWHVAYHGTGEENANRILENGLRGSTRFCHSKHGCDTFYLSPSIEYS